MIIDSPIVSGSFLSTGSLSQIGNATITGSLNVSGSGISLAEGTFSGSGANLFNIPAAGIVGLNLSQIASGSVSAQISPNLGLVVNTKTTISGSTQITGSLGVTGSFSVNGAAGVNVFSSNADILFITGALLVTGSTQITGSLSVSGSITGSLEGTASYSLFALTSSYSLGGSGFPFSGSAVITGSLIVSGSGLTITGSVAISTLTTGSGVRYVIADQNGLISAQTASAAIFTTQQVISTANQTNFPITNGYSTGYVTVFVNGTKLSADEYVDTSGTNIIFLTGSTAGDVVEFQKYLPAAGVSNNTLRTVNYFTATLGQTNFNVNYTPGLLDVFYNGAKLDNTEYTAANGTSITLATGSNAGDTLEVDVYSYQVGAFSGIGGTGAANQLAYFNTTNSITGSNNFTVSGSAIIITGSLIVSGSGTLVNIGPAVFSGSVTAVGGFSGSFSGNADSASLAQNSLLLQGTGSIGFATTASFNAVSSSQQQISASLLNVVANYATTGSNSFRANQSITGSLVVSSTITAQTLVVQTVTSSILYSSGSNLFGNQLSNTQTFTGSVNITGSLTVNTTGTEFQVTNNGVVLGNLLTDNHSVTGSLRITGSQYILGNVGIGTTNPAYALDVSGGAQRITLSSPDPFNTVQVPLILSNGAGNGGAGSRLSFNIGGAIPWIQGLIDGVNSNAGAALVFGTTGSAATGIERMRITNGGNVLVGGGADISIGTSNLVITNNTITNSRALVFYSANSYNPRAWIIHNTSTTSQNLTFDSTYGNDTGTANFNFLNGNVGIGTSNPTDRLYVTSNGFNVATFNSTYGQMSIGFANSGTAFAYIGSGNSVTSDGAANNDLGIGTGGLNKSIIFATGTGYTRRMTITSGGNIGIANATPTYRLDVSGTVRIADGGRLYINQLLPLGIVFRNDEFPDGDANNTQVTDAQATNGNAKRRLSSAPSTTFFYGPYTTIPAGTYIAYFRLKVTNNSSASNILYMDITNVIIPGGGITINPNSFTTSNRYQYFKIPFIVTDPTNVIEFRGLSFVGGITDIFLDHVMVLPGS